MKKAYLSATLSALCFATLGTCFTASAASRSPLIAPDAVPAAIPAAVSTPPKVGATDGKRSLPMLQAILGQWTAPSGRIYSSSNLSKIDRSQLSQASQTVGSGQTARMQAPLNWLNAMTLKLTTNRHVLTEFLDRAGKNLSSKWIDQKEPPQPRK